MSLSNQTLDLYDDLGKAQLREIAANAPPFIKTARVSEREEIAKLPTEEFALHVLTKEGSRMRRYPIQGATDTWLSCAYFEKNAHKLPKQAARLAATHLKFACERHSLDTPAFVEKWAVDERPVSNLYVEDMDMKKTASAPEIEARPATGAYALGNRYPLFNEGFVKKAAAYFVDYFGQFDPADRHAFARNVLERAHELNVDLGSQATGLMNKVAGSEYGDRLDHQLNMRREFAQFNAEALNDLEKIASVQKEANPEQFARLLSAWDKDNNMERSYGRYLLDPYQATFDRQFKKEASYVWEDEQSGESLDGNDLESVVTDKYDKIKSYFGATVADSLKKHGSSIFESLPVDAKVTIARIAKGNL